MLNPHTFSGEPEISEIAKVFPVFNTSGGVSCPTDFSFLIGTYYLRVPYIPVTLHSKAARSDSEDFLYSGVSYRQCRNRARLRHLFNSNRTH